jgi:hypothetical protein
MEKKINHSGTWYKVFSAYLVTSVAHAILVKSLALQFGVGVASNRNR